MGQRLIRKLCVDCREDFEPDETILKQISEIFGTSSPGVMKQIHALEVQALEGGIGKTNPSKVNKRSTAELATTETKILKLWRVHEDGCESCGHAGYRGRIGMYEVLSTSPTIQKLIVNRETSDTIQEQAIKEGMVTLQIDGFIKALRGQTTVEEILRVTSEK